MARWFTFIVFGGAGLGFLYIGVTQYVLQRHLRTNALTIDVEIVKSEVFKGTSSDTDNRLLRDNSTTSYRPDIRFRYSYGGRDYESDLLRPTIIVRSYASAASAAKEIERFAVGAKVKAYLDIKNPDKAYLIQGKGAGPMVFMILGVLLPPVAWIVGAYI